MSFNNKKLDRFNNLNESGDPAFEERKNIFQNFKMLFKCCINKIKTVIDHYEYSKSLIKKNFEENYRQSNLLFTNVVEEIDGRIKKVDHYISVFEKMKQY
jgi:hypothetical protein